eukprot:XP_011684116.1 PREDICTED: uncharacterized protein LOC100890675 isoform X2 [Strongylocentrotus purpuratus]
MTTDGPDFFMPKVDNPSPKGKQEMPRPKSNKNQTGGNVDQSGEDTNDSGFSDRAPGLNLKEMAVILPTQEEQTRKDEKRDLKMEVSEDSTDAVPSNRPTAPVVPQSTLQHQPCNEKVSARTHPSSVASPGKRCEDGARQEVKRNAVEQTAESEDNTDAVPSNEPTATVTSEPQSTVPLPQQPCDEEVSTRTRPSSDASLGTRCEDGPMQEVKRNAVEQAINLEDEKDLIFYEIAEQVAGSCDLRKMALRLGVTESPVAQVEHDNQQLVTQFYKVFRLFDKKMLNPEDMIKRFLEVLVKTDQVSTAAWLRKRLGIRDLEASLEGGESSPVPHVIPQTETTGRKSNDEFFDIFLVHTGKSENTKKFQTICDRHKWVVKSTMPVGTPVHQEIERMLNSSTHLALIITESDCIRYKNREMSITVEMALQLAYNVGELAGKVLPIRCCNKKSLPLVLQALTGAHIDEESFEERLVDTIDTETRLSRMREKHN